jgi:hypothetical protein
MGKLLALLDLFRKGSVVANPDAWRKHQITATMLGVFIMAAVQLAKVFGYALPIDDDTATAIAGGVLALANVVFNYVSSAEAGILPAKSINNVGTTDTPIVNIVQATVTAPMLEKPIELVSASIIEEAKAAAIKDRQNGNIYGGA